MIGLNRKFRLTLAVWKFQPHARPIQASGLAVGRNGTAPRTTTRERGKWERRKASEFKIAVLFCATSRPSLQLVDQHRMYYVAERLVFFF
jgi:hypothetical protein